MKKSHIFIEIATITYRSGPEWEQRFGRQMISEQDAQLDAQGNPGVPRLSPDFLIETYLDHQVSLCSRAFLFTSTNLLSFFLFSFLFSLFLFRRENVFA